MDVDHVVIWVKDVRRSLDFYVDILGFTPEREDDYFNNNAPFPSVRLNEKTIFDLMEYDTLFPLVTNFTGSEAGGTPINHICLSMTEEEYSDIIGRLKSQNTKLTSAGENSFGAQGVAAVSTYFNDPDGNVLEIRFYSDCVDV
ncbi:VOC family protein [Marinomonas sp. C2222]|uniref:VOC family protein n=1 Tax=Marinomonas sargassi TaxID=2984494 RepID=A0ABT2YRI9_9GAMM|nr:VOC family protein [Marinomonas sargassi]MCV2402504.1 VOC family protein [Marinomonas sargassi]